MLQLLPALSLALTPTVLPHEVQPVVAAGNQFGLDRYGQLKTAEGNLFFSPYSVHKSLMMAGAGARTDTATEMAAVLHMPLDGEAAHRSYAEMRRHLNAGRGKGVQIHLAAALWGQKSYGFQPSFLKLLHNCYDAGLGEVNFDVPEQARSTINGWVEKQTAGKIRDLFGPSAFNPNTRLVLTSAIYFKADWASPFQKDSTRTEPFHVS